MIWGMSLPAQRLGRGPLTRRNKRRISPPGMKPRGESGAGPWFLLCPPFNLKLVLNTTSRARLRKQGPTTKVYPNWISPLIPKKHVTLVDNYPPTDPYETPRQPYGKNLLQGCP